MKATVLLVRHGQTKSNAANVYMGRSDEDLDEVGRDQARRIGERLSRHPVTVVYSSPIQRAVTTALAIAAHHKLQPRILNDLIEVDLGVWQGHSMAEVQQRYPEIWRQSRIDPSGVSFPGGESFSSVAERAVRGLRQVISDSAGGIGVIVTHDIVIRIMAAHVLGVPNSVYRRFEIGNASLTVIRVWDQHVRLLALNDCAHLGSWGDIHL